MWSLAQDGGGPTMEERVHKDNEENHHRRTRVEMLRLCFRLHHLHASKQLKTMHREVTPIENVAQPADVTAFVIISPPLAGCFFIFLIDF